MKFFCKLNCFFKTKFQVLSYWVNNDQNNYSFFFFTTPALGYSILILILKHVKRKQIKYWILRPWTLHCVHWPCATIQTKSEIVYKQHQLPLPYIIFFLMSSNKNNSNNYNNNIMATTIMSIIPLIIIIRL